MNSGIYTAYSGMQAQADALEIAANNLANINTVGYKADKAFNSFLRESLSDSRLSGNLETTVNSSVRSNKAIDFSAGKMTLTGRNLDVAIEGDGFLTVQTPQGVRYTRNGNMFLNNEGVLVTSNGHPVLGTSGRRIVVEGEGSIYINGSGDISLDGMEVDRLKVVVFDDMGTLEKEGNSLFVSKSDPSLKAHAGLQSGFLEEANINAVSSMVQLVEIMRRFESIQKSINHEMNDMNSKAIDKLGRS